MDAFEIKKEMDGFENNLTEHEDPAAEFLAREQSQLAGIIDEANLTNAADSAGSFEMINNDMNHGFDEPINGVVREEPEKIRRWREEQKEILEKKDRDEEKKKEELRAQAKQELQDWLEQHKEAIAKTKAANRNAEKQCVAENDEIEPGTEWERIAKLCDFNPKSNKLNKDVSRMRSIILQLKQNPQAPQAKKAS